MVHAAGGPRPVNSLRPSANRPLKGVILLEPGGPEVDEHPGGGPLLEAAMGRGTGADAGGIQGVPLASGAEDEEDAVHGPAIGDPGVVAAQGVRRPWRQ